MEEEEPEAVNPPTSDRVRGCRRFLAAYLRYANRASTKTDTDTTFCIGL